MMVLLRGRNRDISEKVGDFEELGESLLNDDLVEIPGFVDASKIKGRIYRHTGNDWFKNSIYIVSDVFHWANNRVTVIIDVLRKDGNVYPYACRLEEIRSDKKTYCA